MTDPGHRPPAGGPDRVTVILTAVLVIALCVTGVAAFLLHGSGRPSTAPDLTTPTASPTSAVDGPQEPSATPTSSGPSASPSSALPTPTSPAASPRPSCVAKTVVHPLRVVSFNIHSALHDGHVEIDQIAAELAAMRPDVALLQEVDAHRGYSGWVDMPAVLSTALHMQYAFGVNVIGPTTSHGQSQYGTLVLTRFPILSKTNTPLVSERGLQQRGLLHVVVDVAGTPVSIYNTHLENATGSGSHVDLRSRQGQQVASIVAGDPNPLIVGGDFNSGPTSVAMRAMAGVASDPWPRVGIGSPASHGAPHPTIRIDYLLNRGSDLEAVRAQIGTTAVSDHEPVITDYRLTATTLVGACAHRS